MDSKTEIIFYFREFKFIKEKKYKVYFIIKININIFLVHHNFYFDDNNILIIIYFFTEIVDMHKNW